MLPLEDSVDWESVIENSPDDRSTVANTPLANSNRILGLEVFSSCMVILSYLAAR